MKPNAVRTLAPQPHPPGIYASKYDPELAAFICNQLAAGVSLRALCRANPAMPTEKTVWNWARRHPDFAEAKAVALGVARRNALLAQTKRDRARRRARSKTGRRAWNKGKTGYSARLAWVITDRVIQGETMAEICARPGMPSVPTVYNWLRRYPAFVALYRTAKAASFDYLTETAWERSPWLGRHDRSLRARAQAVKAALTRCGYLWPKRYAGEDWIPGPDPEEAWRLRPPYE